MFNTRVNTGGFWNRFRWWMLAGLAIVVVVATVMSWRRSAAAPPAILVFSPPFRTPTTLRDQLDRWIPQTWPWAWRVERAVFGKRKTVNLFSEIVAVTHPPPAGLASLIPGQRALSRPDGLQIWMLSAPDLKVTRERLVRDLGAEVVASPRMTTGDGMRSSLFAGQSVSLNGLINQVGISAEYLPRIRAQSIDLTAAILFSEVITNPAVAIQTNLDVAVRLQIPKGSGVLLIGPGGKGPQQKSMVFLLSPP